MMRIDASPCEMLSQGEEKKMLLETTEETEMAQRAEHGKSERQRLLLSKMEACYALNISPRKLDYLIAEKAIRVVRIGRRVLISRQALERFAR
jgi:excisionase family DNA binding protein